MRPARSCRRVGSRPKRSPIDGHPALVTEFLIATHANSKIASTHSGHGTSHFLIATRNSHLEFPPSLHWTAFGSLISAFFRALGVSAVEASALLASHPLFPYPTTAPSGAASQSYRNHILGGSCMAIEKVGVGGCGLMGSGIAQVAAQAGCHVTVREVSPQLVEKGLQSIEKNLARLVEKGTLTATDRDQVR